MTDDRRGALRLGVGAAGAALAIVIVIAATSGGPQWFVRFGRHDTALTSYARDVLGDTPVTPTEQGTDGETFWLLARDPLLRSPDVLERYMDRPVYRSQRVLYPLLASAARPLGEEAVFWGLVVVNVAAIGFGTYWAALLARELGAPLRAALAFPLNPGVLTGFFLDSSDVVALALLLGGLLAWKRKQVGWATLAFVAAGLAKEVSLVVPAALFLATVRARPRDALAMAAPPLAAVGAWAVYVRWRLGTETRVQELTGPFAGFVDSYRRSWSPFHDWGNAACAGLLLVVSVAAVVLWWRDRASPVTIAALPFALLLVVLSAQVVALPTNSLRAAAPTITFVAIAAYAAVSSPNRAAPRRPSHEAAAPTRSV
jgi:hypothetical protein